MRPKKEQVIKLVNPLEIVFLPHILEFEHSIIHLN
jgi:hypothetical protein